ncbi:MAG: sigma-70 domain-containing protein [Eubacteriales bacterium]|nr:sigma-70 domain-containing protein [Eubacteriales bacterium]
MGGQAEFLQAVQELERLAETNDNRLDMEEIRDYFSEMNLEEKQLDYICRYLESHRIFIRNRIQRGQSEVEEPVETKEDPLDRDMVNLYMEEIQKARQVSAEQEELLVKKLMSGDVNAKNLLIEANLGFAVSLADEYVGRGLLLGDLIQECNIGLMMAVNEFEPEIHGKFRDYKEQVIRRHVEDVMAEYNQSTRSAQKMASRVNEMNALATAFAREYEREAKPSELAERMGISEEEVRELMKVSLDAIAVLE